MESALDVEGFRRLLPEAGGLTVERHVLANPEGGQLRGARPPRSGRGLQPPAGRREGKALGERARDPAPRGPRRARRFRGRPSAPPRRPGNTKKREKCTSSTPGVARAGDGYRGGGCHGGGERFGGDVKEPWSGIPVLLRPRIDDYPSRAKERLSGARRPGHDRPVLHLLRPDRGHPERPAQLPHVLLDLRVDRHRDQPPGRLRLAARRPRPTGWADPTSSSTASSSWAC